MRLIGCLAILSLYFGSAVVTLRAQEHKPFLLQWPVKGIAGIDWVITGYVDLDSSAGGIRDYRGGKKTYGGHRGTDIAVPNFRWMDSGFPVFALAQGHVVEINEGKFDREMRANLPSASECRGQSNFVELEHPNGYRSRYAHFKNGSILVSVGDQVETGQKIGVIGSSGCSKNPHLHFEVFDEKGALVDPFLDELWDEAPPYDIPITLMDFSVVDRKIQGRSDVIDPPADNIVRISPNSTLAVGMTVAGARQGTQFHIRLLHSGTVYKTASFSAKSDYEFSWWYWNFSVDKTAGTLRVQVFIDGNKTRVNHDVRVTRR